MIPLNKSANAFIGVNGPSKLLTCEKDKQVGSKP